MNMNHIFTQRPGLSSRSFTLDTLPEGFWLETADWLVWLLFHPEESLHDFNGRVTCQVLGEYTEEQWQHYLRFLQLKQEWENHFLQELKSIPFGIGQTVYYKEYGWQKGEVLGLQNQRGYPIVRFGYHKWNPFSGEYMGYQEILIIPEALRAQV